MIKTTKTKDLLTISISLENLKVEEIENFLALVKSSLITRKSKMTDEEAEKISEEIKSSWWKKNKAKIEDLIG